MSDQRVSAKGHIKLKSVAGAFPVPGLRDVERKWHFTSLNLKFSDVCWQKCLEKYAFPTIFIHVSVLYEEAQKL